MGPKPYDVRGARTAIIVHTPASPTMFSGILLILKGLVIAASPRPNSCVSGAVAAAPVRCKAAEEALPSMLKTRFKIWRCFNPGCA